MTKLICKVFLILIFSICMNSCLTIPSSNRIQWDVIENIGFEYDMETLEEHFILFPTVEDRVRLFNKFIEYWNNAMLVKITSEINLNKNSEPELIISRRWIELEYVSFWIYKLQFNHINYAINYEFITDNRRGAANYGSDNRFFNLYNQDKERFYIDVRSERTIISNRLKESENPLALIQAFSIFVALDLKEIEYLFF